MNNNYLHTTIGENVKMMRKKNNLRQIDLAKKIGLKSVTFISLAEVGKRKLFNIDHVVKFAKIFNCTIDDLVKKHEPDKDDLCTGVGVFLIPQA